jgi:hypothetical protein
MPIPLVVIGIGLVATGVTTYYYRDKIYSSLNYSYNKLIDYFYYINILNIRDMNNQTNDLYAAFLYWINFQQHQACFKSNQSPHITYLPGIIRGIPLHKWVDVNTRFDGYYKDFKLSIKLDYTNLYLSVSKKNNNQAILQRFLYEMYQNYYNQLSHFKVLSPERMSDEKLKTINSDLNNHQNNNKPMIPSNRFSSVNITVLLENPKYYLTLPSKTDKVLLKDLKSINGLYQSSPDSFSQKNKYNKKLFTTVEEFLGSDNNTTWENIKSLIPCYEENKEIIDNYQACTKNIIRPIMPVNNPSAVLPVTAKFQLTYNGNICRFLNSYIVEINEEFSYLKLKEENVKWQIK